MFMSSLITAFVLTLDLVPPQMILVSHPGLFPKLIIACLFTCRITGCSFLTGIDINQQDRGYSMS